jgi:hypothetical protein
MDRSYTVGTDIVVEREYAPGVHVIFVDPHGVRRDAIVTIWHCTDDRETWLESQRVNQESWAKQDPPANVPIGETCCNLVWVSGDEKRKDDYGRQTCRESSVVHKGSQPAQGNFWVWPDE